MKEEFKKTLQDGEELLFYGVSDKTKTSMQLGGKLMFILVMALFWAVIIYGGDHLGTIEKVVTHGFLGFTSVGLIYGIINELLSRNKNNDNEFFVTNMQVVLYSPKKGYLKEDIMKLEKIEVSKEKDNYGNLKFIPFASEVLYNKKQAIDFEGVENPRDVAQLVTNINYNIYVYDDKISFTNKR